MTQIIDTIAQIRKAVVFLGPPPKQADTQFFATGFLLSVGNVFHLVTAKHVVRDAQTGEPQDSDLHVFFNGKDGNLRSRALSSIKERFGVDWMFHGDSPVDIAVIPFGLSMSKDDVLTIPDNLFLGLTDLHETYDVLFFSYQPGIKPVKKITPVIRHGMISLMAEDRTFFIDGAAFPGNSGSPVFLKPSPIRYAEQGFSIGADPLGGRFIGLIGEYVPYQEVAISLQTRRPRVVFEENTGLSRVWPADLLNEIIASERFAKQVESLADKK